MHIFLLTDDDRTSSKRAPGKRLHSTITLSILKICVELSRTKVRKVTHENPEGGGAKGVTNNTKKFPKITWP
jgi:hypothetical protein